jgi:hypothetical protein
MIYSNIKLKFIILSALLLYGFISLSILKPNDIKSVIHDINTQGMFAKEIYSGLDSFGKRRITAIKTSFDPNSIELFIDSQLIKSQKDKINWFNFLEETYKRFSTPEGRTSSLDQVQVG